MNKSLFIIPLLFIAFFMIDFHKKPQLEVKAYGETYVNNTWSKSNPFSAKLMDYDSWSE